MLHTSQKFGEITTLPTPTSHSFTLQHIICISCELLMRFSCPEGTKIMGKSHRIHKNQVVQETDEKGEVCGTESKGGEWLASCFPSAQGPMCFQEEGGGGNRDLLPGLLALSPPSRCAPDCGDLTTCWEPPCSWLAFSDAPSLAAASGKLSASTFRKKWWQFSSQDVSSLFAALIQATLRLEACPQLVPPRPLPAESQSHLIAPLLRAC